MKDSFGREIDYMRISITDRCNLRCQYCMPEDIELLDRSEILTFEEIVEICRKAAEAGIKKIKVTGGEPLVRKNCTDLIKAIKEMEGIEKVTLTTNGVYLKEHLGELEMLDGINISLNSLKKDRYLEITGRDEVETVLDSIEAVKKTDIPLKINCVIMKGINDDEILSLAELARKDNLQVRFIELMPIGYGREYVPFYSEEVLKVLEETLGECREDEEVHGNGPARYVKFEGFKGSIGLISAVHGKFCENCNRLRLTSTGKLKTCLCYEGSVDLREAVRTGSEEDISERLKEAVMGKPEQHCFEDVDKITEKKQMVSIGG